MNARNAVVLLGIAAMFVLAIVPMRASDASPLEQALTKRPMRFTHPVAQVPFASAYEK